MFHAGCIHMHDAAQRIFGKLGIAPVGNGGLQEGLVGIGRSRLILRATNDDACVGFLDDMHQHVRVLLLGRLGTVAFGISICRNMERIERYRLLDMAFNVGGKTGVDLVQNILAVPKGPHFANRLVAHTGYNTTHFHHHRINGLALVGPILLRAWQAIADGETLAVFHIGHHLAVGGLMLHVIYAGSNINHGLEHGMARYVLHPLAIDPHFAAIPERFAVLFAGSDHLVTSQFGNTPEGAIAIDERLCAVALGVHHPANEDTMGARILGTLDFTFEACRCIAENRLAGFALLPGMAFEVIGLAARWPSGENFGHFPVVEAQNIYGKPAIPVDGCNGRALAIDTSQQHGRFG